MQRLLSQFMRPVHVAVQDARYAWRTLRREPTFSFAVIACMTLGIGANSAMFSVADALLIRPLPFDQPDALAFIAEVYRTPQSPPRNTSVSPSAFVEWREQTQAFQALAAMLPRNLNLSGEGEPERLRGARVSSGFFSLLGVRPLSGRSFLRAEEEPGATPVVVIGHGLWRRRFGSDPEILGKALRIDGASRVVIGIMPPGFRYPSDSDLWIPETLDPSLPRYREWHYLDVVGRLRPGRTFTQAQAEIDVISRQLAQEYPDTHTGWTGEVTSLHERVVGDTRPRILALTMAVGFLLAIACAVSANLLLARATARSRELALRAALGAGRGRLVSQLLTEGVCLALLSGGLGLVLAAAAIPLIALSPIDAPASQALALNTRVLEYTLLVSLLTGILFSLTPALRFSKPDLVSSLNEGSRGSDTGGRKHLLQAILVMVQVAFALLLLVGTGVMLRSLYYLGRVDPGFKYDHILTMRLTMPRSQYPDVSQKAAFVREALRRLAPLPGVRSAAVTTTLPLSDRDVSFVGSFSIEHRRPENRGDYFTALVRRVTPDYFRTMGIPLRAGRAFTEMDDIERPGVVVVSDKMALQYWPDQNPIGRRMKKNIYDSDNPWLTVIGVVEDVQDAGLHAETEPTWYLPYAQDGTRYVTVALRTSVTPEALIGTCRREIWKINPAMPIYQVQQMEQVLSDSLSQRRFTMVLVAGLSFLGLTLAAIGLYGVLSYFVKQRRHEIGVRIALGARTADVRAMILKRGMLLTAGGLAFGLAIGVAGAIALTGFLSSLLYQVRPMDLPTFVVIPCFLAAVALAASYLPARKATLVDPIEILKIG
ncbi:MAG: ABC transporter permease [bacterium]|nr:ABC transporter permease [bacterium]